MEPKIKKCSKCSMDLDLSNFIFNKYDNRYSSQCKSCRNKRKAQWRLNNLERCKTYDKDYYHNGPSGRIKSKKLNRSSENKKFILELKRESSCKMCGYNKYPQILHYHHLDSSLKLFSISTAFNKTKEEILLEIEKCILVCPTCHAELHLNGTNKKSKNLKGSLIPVPSV